MYNHEIFKQGVRSALLVNWTLRCETPLAIRNGDALSYSENTNQPKTRGKNLRLKWYRPVSIEHQVAALYYGYEVVDGQAKACYVVPPSSVRGALRSWTIGRLVHSDYVDRLSPPPKDDAEETARYVAAVSEALQQRTSGYELVASLFGLATDTRSDNDLPSNAGRMRIETDKFHGADLRLVDAGGVNMESEEGPDNVLRQMTVRNPLDRMTHASRDGGLHHFLEFRRGTTFAVRLTLLNVLESDIGILSLWRRELNDGLLRLGALASIGRGRMAIVGESYTLWRQPGAPELKGHDHFAPRTTVEGPDILDGIWNRYALPADKLASFEPYLYEYV